MSGKTLSDHGLSVATDEDCAMIRVLDEDDEICQEKPGYEVAHGTLTPLAEGEGSEFGFNRGGVHYAQLAQQVHRARTGRANYLAAGMIGSEI